MLVRIEHFLAFNFFNPCHFHVDCKIALVIIPHQNHIFTGRVYGFGKLWQSRIVFFKQFWSEGKIACNGVLVALTPISLHFWMGKAWKVSMVRIMFNKERKFLLKKHFGKEHFKTVTCMWLLSREVLFVSDVSVIHIVYQVYQMYQV